MTSGCDGFDDDDLAFRVAAIREAFEECGVLLARPQGSRGLVDAARLKLLEAVNRAPLARGEGAITAILERERRERACRLMLPYTCCVSAVQPSRRIEAERD